MTVHVRARRLVLGVGAVTLLADLALGAPPSPAGAPPSAEVATPRLLAVLATTTSGTTVRVNLRNLAGRPVLLRSLTRLSLRRLSGPLEPGRSAPAFWAPVDLRTARSPQTSQPQYVRLGPSEARETMVDLKGLAWAEGACACWPDAPLARVVVPGRYELQLEIQDPDSEFWWRSNALHLEMKPTSAIEISAP
jgi:hypothetical protein